MVRSGKKIHPWRSDGTPSELISLGLTKREAEVLAWIARGKGNYDIGVILGTKRRTISKHVEHILTKLNVENRTAAAVVALHCVDESRGRLRKNWRGSHTVIIAFVLARLSELWSDLGEIYTAMGALIDGCGS
jgi:DNA-binding CsgD family transcriptional regulator